MAQMCQLLTTQGQYLNPHLQNFYVGAFFEALAIANDMDGVTKSSSCNYFKESNNNFPVLQANDFGGGKVWYYSWKFLRLQQIQKVQFLTF